MAEVEHPQTVQDWTEYDRLRFTQRWNDANCFNLLQPDSGFRQYRTIRQRRDFYDWFDRIREVQGHEIEWPAAAWIVASQMSNAERVKTPLLLGWFPQKTWLISRAMSDLAEDGNREIFDDVFRRRLSAVYRQGLAGTTLTKGAATDWDAETLRHEQFNVVQKVYEKHVGKTPALREEAQGLASADPFSSFNGLLGWGGGVAMGQALAFSGNILNPHHRYLHGLTVVPRVYRRFKQAIDSSRLRRSQARPDPTAGGRIRA